MTTSHKYFVADLVEEVGSLPTVAAQIVAQTSDPQCDIGDLCRLIQSDGVMTMRFLALANSAALAGANETTDLRAALVRLGLRRVRNVSLFMGMHDMNPSDRETINLDMKEFWKYTLATASCAQGLAWQRGDQSFEDAWLVGILHGIGIIPPVAVVTPAGWSDQADVLVIADSLGGQPTAAGRLGDNHRHLWCFPVPM